MKKVEIRRVQVGHCYARSGNAHNPTPIYTWQVVVNGQPAGTARTLKAAKEIIGKASPTIVRNVGFAKAS